MQSSIPYYATPLILFHKTIYLSTERCTGIYGNNSGTIIGREVRIFSKLAPLVFVFAMAIRSMPVSANNGLILICGLCCITDTSFSLPNCRFAPETQKRPKPDPAVWFRGNFGRVLSI